MSETTTTETTEASDNDLAVAMGIEQATPPVEPIDPPDETPAARRKRKKREAYAAKKSGDDKPPEPTPEPPEPPEQTAKQPERPTARRLTAGSKCPKCDRGLIGVLRTRLQRSKNKRTRVLGCRNLGCLWDLDGDNVRENPINQGKPITD